jgi:WD40 repeat protein
MAFDLMALINLPNRRIHTYPVASLGYTSSHPNSAPIPEPLIHPTFRVTSFYVRLATSPCGNWLASGSTGGNTYIWDIKQVLASGCGSRFGDLGRKPVILKGSEKETGSLDWAHDGEVSTTRLPYFLSPIISYSACAMFGRHDGPSLETGRRSITSLSQRP